jgi:membrane protein DedA with SNARE-associated domain
MDSGTE